MKLSFHGADRSVTGSCHLVECAGRRILIDCGLYQGGRELNEENAEPFGFDPESVDFVLLTHAHLDHCGRLPLLAKRKFRGEIITTAASRELARLVMLDAAHIQEEDARYLARKNARKGSRHAGGAPPLYDILDALNCLDYFGRVATYGQPLELAPGVRATFLDAGHILGSASVLLELEEQNKQCRVLLSGDLGNAGRPLLRTPEPAAADVVVMETTYGDRRHKSLPSSVEELFNAVNDTFQRGGNVIIPTFALERAQELLFFLREGHEQGRFPVSPRVFLDSPMAISATQIFEHHPECYNPETRELFRDGKDPFALPNLNFTRESADSKAINDIESGAIIMAGSGMCTGGRVRHHLRHNLGRKESSVVFVGYAAQGTLARRIIEGAKHVRLFGDEIRVLATIHTIGGFSAHADQAELLEWHGQTSARRTILVHGDEDVMQHFAGELKNTQVEMPKLNQTIDL
jgi:metallo-beta-lactamase family protein